MGVALCKSPSKILGELNYLGLSMDDPIVVNLIPSIAIQATEIEDDESTPETILSLAAI